MTLKPIISIVFRYRLFVVLVVVIGTACAKASDGSGFRVALLTPGPISDQAWNAGAYQGMMRIRDSLGAQTSHIQVKTPADFEENFRQYAASGYTLVIGHGFEFQDAAARVAPSFPKTMFVTTGGSTTTPNLAALSFAFEEPSYLAGMAAAAVSKSGVVGCIGGTELPPVKASFAAFVAGVHAVTPTATILTAYLGNWDDVSAGKEQALALIQRGADVIFQNADAAGLGVFQAAKEHPGISVIGSNSNQNAVAPGLVLGSVVIDLPHAFLLVAKEVAGGSFRGRVIPLGMRDDVVRWEPADVLSTRLTPAHAARMDSTRLAMQAGRFALSTVSP
jgi:basic membrane lipoprotein Med (substrate-binding protein (PBP1-ABC) superfamily)